MRAFDWYQNYRPWILGWDWTAKMHSGAEKMRLLEPTAQIWMKIDPYCQRQNVLQWLVSANIRCMQILAGVPLGGGLRWEWGGWRRQLLAIWVATSSETSDIRPAILYGVCYTPCQPVIDCKMNDLEWPWVNITRKTRFSCTTSFRLRGFGF